MHSTPSGGKAMTNEFPKPPQGIKCECGGTLVTAILPKYDFSGYVGFEVMLNGMEGLRCDKCGGETLPGGLINVVLNYTIVQIVKQPRRLNGAEARYLRHSMDATQEELATRMGIARETVGKWECGGADISAQHDFVLRVFALTMLIGQGLLPAELARQIMADTFVSVRAEPPRPATTIDVDLSDIGRMRTLAAQRKPPPAPRSAVG